MGLLGMIEPATGEGLGASYAAEVSTRRVGAAIFLAVAIGLGALGLWVVPACLLTAAIAWAVGRLARRKLGGLTGDVLGTAQQVAETLVLLLGAVVVAKGWPGLPWWR